MVNKVLIFTVSLLMASVITDGRSMKVVKPKCECKPQVELAKKAIEALLNAKIDSLSKVNKDIMVINNNWAIINNYIDKSSYGINTYFKVIKTKRNQKTSIKYIPIQEAEYTYRSKK